VGKENKKPKSGNSKAIAMAIKNGSLRESKVSALMVLLQFGSKEDKRKATQQLWSVANGAEEEKESEDVDILS
jgi:hypothetical protein